jgi:hypothetical protein
MRPVAVGRKNWIHVGSAQAGPKIAAILSIVESCRRLKLSVRDYLSAILPGLAEVPMSRVSSLTPPSWANSPDSCFGHERYRTLDSSDAYDQAIRRPRFSHPRSA